MRVSGLGHAIVAAGTRADPVPHLKLRKMRKFMSVQDDLAVIATGLALASAGLAGVALGERTGLYLAVGYLPFERSDIEALLKDSVVDGGFSMSAFASGGYCAVNPLLTFRCLPNMAAYHISANFDVQGPYFVTYPGPGQFYVALQEAIAALESGRVDVALVAGVAHQRNFLVEHHFSRIDAPVEPEGLADAAGCLVLETAAHSAARAAPARGRLLDLDVSYSPHDPFSESPAFAETFDGTPTPVEAGSASLPARLSQAAAGGNRRLVHDLRSRDGIRGRSAWELL